MDDGTRQTRPIRGPYPYQFGHAVELLRAVLDAHAPADAVLNAYFHARPKLGARDRGFVAEAVFTALRQWRRLEIAAASSDPERIILAGLISQTGGVNGLLHLMPDADASWAHAAHARLAAGCSDRIESGFPDWVFDRLTPTMATTAIVDLGRSLQQPAPLDLRVNPLKATRDEVLLRLRDEGYAADPTPFSPVGLRLARKASLRSHPLFTAGMIEVQDEGSQLLAYLLDPQPGERIADYCAGAGGKTLLLGALMRSRGTLYALDVSARRLANLTPRLRRSGLSNVHPRLIRDGHDPALKRLRASMDRVLVDAPCSGFGTLRRNPDLKWRHTPETVADMGRKQRAILDAAAELVRSGGCLLYATCSLLPDENERVIDVFLAGHPGFALHPAAPVCAAAGIALPPAPDACLRLRTDLHGTDCFFAALMRKA